MCRGAAAPIPFLFAPIRGRVAPSRRTRNGHERHTDRRLFVCMIRGGVMETAGLCNDSVLPVQEQSVWADILAQAVTGELIGAMNYGTLAEMCDDAADRDEAREHAEREADHARLFRRLGEAIGTEVRSDVKAP